MPLSRIPLQIRIGGIDLDVPPGTATFVGVYDSARAIFTDDRNSSFGQEQKQKGGFGDCAAYHGNYFWDGFSKRCAVEGSR